MSAMGRNRFYDPALVQRYRTLPDPHDALFEWRVVEGFRQFRIVTNPDHDWPGFPDSWMFSTAHSVAVHTPERLALWAELLLDPFA